MGNLEGQPPNRETGSRWLSRIKACLLRRPVSGRETQQQRPVGSSHKTTAPAALTVAFSNHTRLNKNGTVGVGVDFKSDSDITVDALWLEVLGRKFPSLGSKPVSFRGAYNLSYMFNLSAILDTVTAQELASVRLVAHAGGGEYTSQNFDISSLVV